MVPVRYAHALRLALRGLSFVVSVCAALAATSAPPPVDFNRDIRPILSDRCYACHGPDENKRKGGLRLDKQADAFKELKSGKHALIAGDTAKSTLVERILTADTEEVMPPPKTGKPLTKAQVELLQRWVQEGAKWKEHWSFLPPERAALQAELNDGAPLAWMCRAFSMTLAVNDDGEPMCSGKAMWNGDEVVAENIAAFHLMGSCTAANGVAKLGGTVQAGAPQLVVRCTATRFGERWQASK